MNLWRSKTKLFCEASFKNDILTGHLTSEFQYVLTIFKWMLRKYCACHEKVEPRHTKSCNCHAKWSLQSNTSVTWNLQPFHGFSVGGFKHRHHKARNHCACHAKRIVSDPLQIPHACQRFLQPSRTPAPATYFATCRNPCACHAKHTLNLKKRPETVSFLRFWLPNLSRAQAWCKFCEAELPKVLRTCHVLTCFNDFDFQIALARRRGANFVDVNFQKCSRHASFKRFWLPNRSRAQAWCKFCRCELPKVLRHRQFLTILTSKSLSRAGVAQILSRSTSKSAPGMSVFKDFDFQIALARRRGANFVDILDSRSFATPVFRTYLCELSKRQNYGKTQHFEQFLPAKTSLLSNIDAARPTGNFQYSRKLELLNFLWLGTVWICLATSGHPPPLACITASPCVSSLWPTKSTIKTEEA